MGQKPADLPEDILRRLYFEEKLTQEAIAKELGCSQGAVYRRMKKHGIPARTTAEAHLILNGSLRRDFDGDLCAKAYLLGFCKGDVHPWIRGKKAETIRLMSATTKPEQIELFQKLFAPYGRVYISKPDTRGAIHMAAHVNMSMSFLLDREDNIPDWVLADEDVFFAFFAGYSDAEAHIGVHNAYAVFKLDTYDKNILAESYRMLRKVGITAPAPFICARQGQRTKQGHVYRRDMWRLQVGAKTALLLLFERMSPYLKHSKRVQDMQAAIQNIKDRNSGKRPAHLRKAIS